MFPSKKVTSVTLLAKQEYMKRKSNVKKLWKFISYLTINSFQEYVLLSCCQNIKKEIVF